MKILIVENNKNDLIETLSLIDKYNQNHEINILVTVEDDYEKVLSIADEFDFLMMDIELDHNTNGIDLACQIRKFNRDIKIIFVSNFSKYLIDGYKAKADLYLLKPVSQHEFDKSMDELAWDYIYHHAGIIDERYSMEKIYFHEILYIEILSRKLYIHFTNSDVFANNDTLLKWMELLKDYPFVQPHRAFLVNMEHIQALNKKEIKLKNGEILQITDNYIDIFKKEYLRYLNRKV